MVKPKKNAIWNLVFFYTRTFSRYLVFDVHNFKCWGRYGRNVSKRLKKNMGIVVCNLSPKPKYGNSKKGWHKKKARVSEMFRFIVYMFDSVSFFWS